MENGLLVTHITWHINTDTYKFDAGLFNLKELTKWRCDLQMGFINDCVESTVFLGQ